MNAITNGVVKVLRTAGKSLDSMGKVFEVYPYEEKCKFFVVIGHEFENYFVFPRGRISLEILNILYTTIK